MTISMGASSPSVAEPGVVMVFEDTLASSMETIRALLPDYNVVALDTVWSGNAARAVGDFGSSHDFQYQCLRCNVSMSRVLQLSLAFYDEEGGRPIGEHTFTFNFQFSQTEDLSVKETHDKLCETVPFTQLEKRGIKRIAFGQMLITSGLVCMDSVRWVVYNGAWDLGFVMRTMLRRKLDPDATKFAELLRMFFKRTHDIRTLLLACPDISIDAINDLHVSAKELDVSTDDSAHVSSADSQRVGRMYFKLQSLYEAANDRKAFDSFDNALFEFRGSPTPSSTTSNGNQLVSGISALTSSIMNAREYMSPSPLTVGSRGRAAREDGDAEVTSNEQASRPQLAAPGTQRAS